MKASTRPAKSARALVALTGAPPFDRDGAGDALAAIATAAVAHCRRLLDGAAQLAESGMGPAAGPLARAVFEAAVPLVWTLGEPAGRGPRYLMERGRAMARLHEAASRAGLMAAGPAAPVARELRPRTRSDALPPFDRMARGVGLGREDVVLRRAADAAARGGFGAPPLDGDPIRIASVVFARLAVATAHRLDPEGAAEAERRILAVLAGDAGAVADALSAGTEPVPEPRTQEAPPPEPAVAAEVLVPDSPDAPEELATADGFASPPRPRGGVTYVIVDGEQPRVLGPDDVGRRDAAVDGEPVEEEADELSDFLDTF